MSTPNVLVVDDEELVRWSLKERFERSGYRVIEAGTAAEAIQHLAEPIDLVVLDYRLPDGDGLGVLREIKEVDADTPVILMTGYSSVENAVEAMKQGAYDYVNKPFSLDEIQLLAEKALETNGLRREVRALRATQGEPYGFERIVGESPSMKAIKTLLQKVATSPVSTVLITGETGTGKDLAAKAIHANSDRGKQLFVNITCPALPENLLESELFGHERGAFTDAKQQKKGLFETAAGGTVFLDEISEMAFGLQAKLLRFLEEKTFKRVGGLRDIRVDVRVIAATNRNLEECVEQGRFRPDLYYRLTVLPISLPPLRERPGDVALLTKYFVDQFNGEFRKKVRGISDEALGMLSRYRWPGNVRELKNAVERAMLLAESDILTPEHFHMLGTRDLASLGFQLPAGGIDFEQLERDLIVQALRRAGGNRTRAAGLLGMNRDQIRYRIEKFGLDGSSDSKE